MLEALIEVWSEELAQAGRIELESFLVLEVKRLDRGERTGTLLIGGKLRQAPHFIKKTGRQAEQVLEEAPQYGLMWFVKTQ
jgi:hypothetical protein